MNKAALTKPAIGVLVGASIALAASAGASQTTGNWFSSITMDSHWSGVRWSQVADGGSVAAGSMERNVAQSFTFNFTPKSDFDGRRQWWEVVVGKASCSGRRICCCMTMFWRMLGWNLHRQERSDVRVSFTNMLWL